MTNGNDDLHEKITADDYSLESILAEYKGSAYINGDKKTPPELLKEQADKIIMEAIGKTQTDAQFKTGEPEIAEEGPPDIPDAIDDQEQNSGRGAELQSEKETDKVVMFFENYQHPAREPQESIVRDVEKAIEREISYGEEPDKPDEEAFFPPVRTETDDDGIFAGEQAFIEDETYIEPDLKDAAKDFAEAYGSISLRSIPAMAITLVMVIMTFAFESGLILPFSIGRSESVAAGALVISLLIVMMLCVDLVIRGAANLIHGTLSIETLILFSCTFSIISGTFTIISDTVGILPYCAVSAMSLTCAAFGEKYNLRAIAGTLKTASGSSEPYGVQAEYNADIKRSVLKKVYNRTDGFYNNLIHPDVAETVYRYAAPFLLAAALVLSIISALTKGHGQYFLHILSALLAAAAPFSAMLAFSVPFSIVVKSLRKSGAAIAGWGGAEDVCSTDGACVTDDDLFPSGTLKFNGSEEFGGVSLEKAIRYTASLIAASGSGLSRLFSEELNAQRMKTLPVEDFACYEGGIFGLVHGERVMAGSAAFIKLQHIEIPEEMNLKNAVYTAVDNALVAMFAINYNPQKSVQSALISILKWKIKLFFAVRDFNITPLMLQQKFRVPLEDIEYIQAKDSYNISDQKSGKAGRMSAVLIREGFSPFAEAVTGGKLLRTSALVAAVISVVSAAIGVLFMFYMCWHGAFISAKPGNLILFMLSMLAAVLVICGYAKLRK